MVCMNLAHSDPAKSKQEVLKQQPVLQQNNEKVNESNKMHVLICGK